MKKKKNFFFLKEFSFVNRNITDKREQISDAPALYFIQPTKENIDLICQVKKER